jgi:3-deoxy-D-manno-octulosonic-acid transferase
VVVSGNLKYDAPGGGKNGTVRRIGGLLWKPKLLVAGSTHEGEEQALLKAWETVRRQEPDTALLIAPRHPQRFDEVWELLRSARLPAFKCSYLMSATEPIFGGTVLLLDSIGDLAEMYGIASAAFVGGSLVPRGGQNPLEAARFGIPVVMGPSFENFREVSEKMIAESTLKVIDPGGLAAALVDALRQEPTGQRHFQGQTGATRKTVEALTSLLHA